MNNQINFIGAVRQFHKNFNHPTLDNPEIPNEDRVKLRIELLAEEVNEFVNASFNKDITEVADSFCDIMYVLCGAIHEFGMAEIFPLLFAEVHRSNMSKACATEEEARRTVQHYVNEKQTLCYYEKVDTTYIVYRESDNKALKSINYSPVDFSKIHKCFEK